jgi:hypothetical protein
MFSLNDDELKVIMRLAAPIAPRLRGLFLQNVAAELEQLQQQGAHGDGAAYRVARGIAARAGRRSHGRQGPGSGYR